MKKIALRTVSTVTVASLLLTGCGSNKLDVLAYPKQIKTKVKIPDICMAKYKTSMPTVAVMDFTNNSTFGKANTSSSDSKSNHQAAAVVGVGVTSAGIGMGMASASKSASHTTSVQRKIDPKLSKSIIGPLETLIVSSGGAKLFTRSDFDKVNAELKFQDSGLIDPDSAVKFGKTSGVKYIITGSLDNVEQKYRDNSKAAGGVSNVTAKSDNKSVQMLGSLLKMGASMTDGMIISVKMTIKMLDVETGKIVFSKELEQSGNIGKIRQPNYDQIIGGVKSAMLKALPELKKDFSDYFAVKGYITKLKSKGDDIIAQVNIGRNSKVVENQIFNVYKFEESEDPMSGKQTCDVIETTIQLRASQQITKDTTWTTVEEGDATKLKLGQLVRKSYKKAGFELPKLSF